MFAVGRLGSYISQGVYTVSGPFHPFGGAVDIIVVQQQDGSFKSSPWYVRFGKFQGVLKSKEKVVTICVEGVDVGFNMLLDNKGEAYFLREVDEGEELESALFRFSSCNETNRQSHKDTGQRKSKSCNFDSFSGCDNPMDMSKEKDTGRAKTGQSRIMGIFGRKTTKEETQTPRGKEVNNNNNDSNNHARASSLERAEMATDLMDMQWSTNIPSKKTDGGNDKADKDFKTEKLKRSSEEAGVGVRSRTSSAGEVISLTSRETDERDGDANGITGPRSRATCGTCAGNADHAAKANGVVFPNSQYQCPVGCEGRSAQQFLVQQSCRNQRDSVSQGRAISQMDGDKNGLQTSLNREMSDSSIDGFNDSSKQTSHTTTEQPPEDTHTQQPELAVNTENHCEQTRSSRPCTPERNEEDLRNSSRVSESCSEIHRVDPVLGSSNSGQEIEDEKIFGDGSIRSSLHQNVSSDGDSKRIYVDSISTEVTCDDGDSQSSEEEQFLFGDLDEDKLNAVHKVEPKSPDHKDKENHHLFGLDGAKEMHRSVSTSYESYSSVDQFVRENPSADSENLAMKSSEISNPIGIPRTPKTPVVGRLGESVPNMWFHVEDLDDSSSGCHSLRHSLDASPGSLKWTLLGKDDSNWLHSNAEREGQLGKERLDPDDAQISGEPYSASVSPKSGRLSFGSEQKIESKGTIAVAKPVQKDSSKPPATQGGKWRIWPFGFRTTRSGNNNEAPPGYVRLPDSEDAAESAAEIVVESAAESAVESAAESAVESAAESVAESVVESAAGSTAESLVDFDVGKSELTYKGVKKILRSLTPTSEQLASLKLSEGKNSITFTFSTGMLGEQQVDARIYLWKWNTRIVISDVDGTITKSDVLGQFMPMVGIDWCQTGVTHLFSAIKENGYQLLFLSARAIAQAYTTRQFLLSIKQDGKGLPDGPIVISPDGLFPSLFREVIRRAPHEFKIACLEDIKALFPVGSNPFYAGFGNRDTDEISYLKVGIPMGKIFIINPKGEVAVNRRVDRKSYTSLHNLVNGMFPPTEPEQEDFNSWNFWKMPPPSLM